MDTTELLEGGRSWVCRSVAGMRSGSNFYRVSLLGVATLSLSTDSDGSPYADQRPRQQQTMPAAHSRNDSNESYGKQAPAGEFTTDDRLERPAEEASRTSTVEHRLPAAP